MTYLYVDDLSCTDIILKKMVVNSQSTYDKSSKTWFLKLECGFDTETSKVPLDKNVFGVDSTAYCYHWQLGVGDKALLGRTLDSMLYTFQALIDCINTYKPKHKLIILDANLGYEWQFCKHYWSKLEITRIFAKEKRKPLQIEIANTLKIIEVIGLFGYSLADIAKKYTPYEKLIGDLDHEMFRNSETELTPIEIGYAVRDVEILCELGKHIYKTYMGKNEKMPITKTAIVRNAVKKEAGSKLKSLREEFHDVMPTEDEYELFRTYLFKGGISGSNIKMMNKTLCDSIMGADITSDYPYQMLSKKFPQGKATRCPVVDFMSENIPYIAIVKFHKFRSKSSHALLSSHKALNKKFLVDDDRTVLDNNRIQYAEELEIVVNDVEFNSLKKAYAWKHAYIMKCWEFKEGYKMLPQYVRKTCMEWYLKKETLKEKFSETQEYRSAKEFVNSIFGMMCTALYFENYEFNEEKCEIAIPTNENDEPIFKEYEECINNLFLSPYWGFWITSYAREMLIDVISKFPECIIQYDTDSVYFDVTQPESQLLLDYLNHRNSIMRKQNELRFMKNSHMLSLGTWDFTEVFKRFKALGAKRYMYEKQDGKIKVVIAGHRKDKNGRPTLLNQCDYNNKVNGTNIDYFDFFTDKMVIDKEHSNKLCSHYIDFPVRVDFTDYQGNTQEVFCPSAIVLEQIEFNMKLGVKHGELLMAVERQMRNTHDRKAVWKIWKELKK